MRAYELHASPKQVQRSKGRSAVAAAAYRSATHMIDDRTGEIHDYRKKQGVEHTRIYTPDNSPEWASNREKLWNEVEAIEKKSNSMTAREWEIAFPCEFNKMQRMEAGESISKELIRRYNCAVDIAFHEPSKDGDQRNHHAHILYTTRGFDENTATGWQRTKYRNFSHDLVKDKNGKTVLDNEGRKLIRSSQEALEMRLFFANEMNRIAARDKLHVKTEHLSFEQRGIDKKPTKHLGSTASQMEREEGKSRIGDENRKINAANDNIQKLKEQKKVIILQYEREKRKLELEEIQQKNKLSWFSNINTEFEKSKDGQAFKTSIEPEGLHLAKGKTGGFVLVDEAGEIHSLVKNIEGKTYKEVADKLANISHDTLQDAEILAKEIKETRAQQQQPYDRDAEELKQQNALADAAEKEASAIAKQQIEEEKAEKQAQKILNNERKARKLLESKRIKILTRAKEDWGIIKAQQAQEKENLTHKLRDADSREEKAHRQHWQPIINQEHQRKEKLQAQLDKKGMSGAYYRARHGKKAREEIKAINQNISNATMRLEDRIGGLNRQDKFMLGKLNKEHYLQRSELKNHIDAELEQLKESSPKKAAVNAPETNEIEGMDKRKIKRNVSSLEEWESNARVNDAMAAAAKAEQKNIPIEELRRQEEQQRQDSQFEEPKNTLEKNNASVEHDFNHLSERQNQVVTASPEQIQENIEAQKSHNQNVSTSSFMDGLSAEHREKVAAYKQDNPVQENEAQSHEQGQSPDLE